MSDATLFGRAVIDRLTALEVSLFGGVANYSDITNFERAVLARIGALEIQKFGSVTVEPDITSFTRAVLDRLTALEGAGTLGTLSLSATTFTRGVSASGTILGATGVSAITSSGLPSGLTINSGARTWAWDGSGSGSSNSTLTLTETLAGYSNTPHNTIIGYSIIVGGSLATPTVTNISASGASPLVLSISDGDYIAGNYLEWEFAGSLTPPKNGDGSYTTQTQHGVTFIEGDSWARLDLALGYNTPSGPFAFDCRVLRDNPTGAVTVTDQLGNTFNADASGWSTDYTDTISVSSALLTAAAGTSMSKLMTVSAAGKHWNVDSGGAIILSRATIAAANVDFYTEMTVGALAASGVNIIGVTDTSIDFNGGGSGFFGGGSAFPGDPTFNGCSLIIDGSIWVGWRANGTTGTFNIPGGANGAAGDVIGLQYNSSTNLLTCYYKHAAGAMVSIGTVTLTSLIPATPYAFAGGKNTGDNATVNFGATTFALAGPGTQGAPSGSNIYG